MDFPIAQDPVLPLYVGVTSRYGAYSNRPGVGPAAGALLTTTNWGTANLACYVPFSLPFFYPVTRVWWYNGSAVSGNVDFGIYSAKGTRIYSTGAIAQAGTTVMQFVTPTAFVLCPGQYFFAISLSSSTGRIVSVPSTFSLTQSRYSGLMEQASAHPLPATATFATIATVAVMPLMGVTRHASL
jgi:hypothetical protein